MLTEQQFNEYVKIVMRFVYETGPRERAERTAVQNEIYGKPRKQKMEVEGEIEIVWTNGERAAAVNERGVEYYRAGPNFWGKAASNGDTIHIIGGLDALKKLEMLYHQRLLDDTRVAFEAAQVEAAVATQAGYKKPDPNVEAVNPPPSKGVIVPATKTLKPSAK